MRRKYESHLREICGGFLHTRSEVKQVPMKPKKPCKHPNCPELTHDRYCSQHSNIYERERGSSSQRGYDRKWQAIRKRYLIMFPLCGGYYGRKIWNSNDKNRKIIFRCNDKYKIKGEITCKMPHINVVTLETAFTDMFNSIFENKERVIETLESTLNEVLNTDANEKVLLSLNFEFETLTLEINNLIKLNATTKLDQKKYSKDYNKMADRYKCIQEEILSQQEKLDAMKNTREYTIGFIDTLKNTDDILSEFDANLFHSVIENIMVLGKDKLEFNFKDGLKIEWTYKYLKAG